MYTVFWFFFANMPFVVNRAIDPAPTERSQHHINALRQNGYTYEYMINIQNMLLQ